MIWLAAAVIMQGLDQLLCAQIPALAAEPSGTARELTRSILGAAIWIPYLGCPNA